MILGVKQICFYTTNYEKVLLLKCYPRLTDPQNDISIAINSWMYSNIYILKNIRIRMPSHLTQDPKDQNSSQITYKQEDNGVYNNPRTSMEVT